MVMLMMKKTIILTTAVMIKIIVRTLVKIKEKIS